MAIIVTAEDDTDLRAIITRVLSGYRLYELLRARPATHEVPVIFVTGNYDSTGIRLLPVTRARCIRKPFRPPELLRHVADALCGDLYGTVTAQEAAHGAGE